MGGGQATGSQLERVELRSAFHQDAKRDGRHAVWGLPEEHRVKDVLHEVGYLVHVRPPAADIPPCGWVASHAPHCRWHPVLEDSQDDDLRGAFLLPFLLLLLVLLDPQVVRRRARAQLSDPPD